MNNSIRSVELLDHARREQSQVFIAERGCPSRSTPAMANAWKYFGRARNVAACCGWGSRAPVNFEIHRERARHASRNILMIGAAIMLGLSCLTHPAKADVQHAADIDE